MRKSATPISYICMYLGPSTRRVEGWQGWPSGPVGAGGPAGGPGGGPGDGPAGPPWSGGPPLPPLGGSWGPGPPGSRRSSGSSWRTACGRGEGSIGGTNVKGPDFGLQKQEISYCYP